MKASDSSVLDFISGRKKSFIIPPFQRNYEWTETQCEDLFNDIVSSFNKNKEHYLGNVVYYIGKNSGATFQEYILIDGQQRITTLLLLLCALRDSGKDENLTSTIDNDYLLNPNNEKFRIRLKQTSYDYQNFSDIVEKRKIRDEECNIAKNYRKFIKLIEETSLSVTDICNTIENLKIVDVNLQIDDDLEAVQTIFEKINSTGKPLSPADLIRNFLLISSSAQEQESLYQNYWVEIEKAIGTDYISKFAQDYLILKTCDDVEKDLIYQKFKKFFTENQTSHETVLKEMLKYSRFYSWIINQNCEDAKLGKSIEELNVLQTADCYCLYIYLMAELYETDLEELRKIFNLLSDFMLRYRIVAPGGGGGSLRSVVHQLLDKFSNENIKLNFDNLYFELSNSSSKSGRFPDDEEFSNALKISKKANHRYGKVLYRKIEEDGKKYISIPLSEITVEHLVPQTPTKWWDDNFGGKDKSIFAYEKYLNSIGNLTIMSQGGNSVNSNKPWSEKLKQISECQFLITSDISKKYLTEWKENQIEERNDEIAKLACKVVTPPLPRTRQITSVSVVTGNYPISDESTNMNGSEIVSLLYNGNAYEIGAWNQLFNTVCKICYDIDSAKFEKIVEENKIHKSKNLKDGSGKCPFITKNAELLVDVKKIGESEYYSESVLSCISSRKISKQLLDLYNITDQFEIFVKEKSTEED